MSLEHHQQEHSLAVPAPGPYPIPSPTTTQYRLQTTSKGPRQQRADSTLCCPPHHSVILVPVSSLLPLGTDMRIMHYIAATTDADDDDATCPSMASTRRVVVNWTCPSMASTRTVVVNWTASQISQKKSKSFARFFSGLVFWLIQTWLTTEFH